MPLAKCSLQDAPARRCLQDATGIIRSVGNMRLKNCALNNMERVACRLQDGEAICPVITLSITPYVAFSCQAFFRPSLLSLISYNMIVENIHTKPERLKLQSLSPSPNITKAVVCAHAWLIC